MITRKIHLGIFVLAVLMLVLAACTQSPDATATKVGDSTTGVLPKNADGYTDITVEQLAEMLSNKDFTLVNVHVPFQGDIPQTDLSIPFDRVADNVDQLPETDAPIVVYCRSGSMSGESAQNLVNMGYTNVWNLSGGFNAWQRAGFELDAQQ